MTLETFTIGRARAPLQLGNRRAADEERPLQVDVEDAVPLLGRRRLHGPRPDHAGVVHEDREPAERLDRPAHGLGGVVLLPDVADDGLGPAPRALDLRDEQLERLGAPGRDGDGRAERGERERDRRPMPDDAPVTRAGRPSSSFVWSGFVIARLLAAGDRTFYTGDPWEACRA